MISSSFILTALAKHFCSSNVVAKIIHYSHLDLTLVQIMILSWVWIKKKVSAHHFHLCRSLSKVVLNKRFENLKMQCNCQYDAWRHRLIRNIITSNSQIAEYINDNLATKWIHGNKSQSKTKSSREEDRQDHPMWIFKSGSYCLLQQPQNLDNTLLYNLNTLKTIMYTVKWMKANNLKKYKGILAFSSFSQIN